MNPRKSLQMVGIVAAGAVVAALTAATPAAAQPISFIPCTPGALVSAITTANTAGGGELLLSPGCTYCLTAPAMAGADTGLPQITTPIEVVGLGAIISRSSTAPAFRILDVAATGNVTLSGLTITGGAPLSDGGGICNAGTLTLRGTNVRGNTSGGQGGGLLNSGGTITLTLTAVIANTPSNCTGSPDPVAGCLG